MHPLIDTGASDAAAELLLRDRKISFKLRGQERSMHM